MQAASIMELGAKFAAYTLEQIRFSTTTEEGSSVRPFCASAVTEATTRPRSSTLI